MYLNAKALFIRAGELASTKNGLGEAEKIAATLLQHKPDDPSSLALLAKIMAMKEYYGAARQLNYRALDLLPPDKKYDLNRAEYLNNIGYCCRFLNLYEEGRECYQRAISLAPESVDIYGNLAGMYVARCSAEEGLKYSEIACAQSPDDLSAQNNKAIMLLELGRWEEGFSLYDARMCLKADAGQPMYREYPGDVPLWDGTPGQNVVVYGEQGIGDEIMFASMLPDIMKDCQVTFDCHDRLYNLFQQSFGSLTIHPTKRLEPDKLEWWGKTRIDAKIPIGSLAKYYRKNDEDFPKAPYLKVNKKHAAHVGQRIKELGNKPKIGISWSGGTVNTHTWQRHIPLQMWDDIFKLDADFISLQYDRDAESVIADYCMQSGNYIHHWPDLVLEPDYYSTACLVANLDMVISVPQSVVHLAGAMGIPAMALTPKHAMWQWGVYGKDRPWYGSVKSYWQDEPDQWEPVLKRVRNDLKTLFNISAKIAA